MTPLPPEGWQWDETLYLGSAPYYVRGRPPYAPGVQYVHVRSTSAGCLRSGYAGAEASNASSWA